MRLLQESAQCGNSKPVSMIDQYPKIIHLINSLIIILYLCFTFFGNILFEAIRYHDWCSSGASANRRFGRNCGHSRSPPFPSLSGHFSSRPFSMHFEL